MALSKITAGSIADGTVVAADIADGSITGPKLGATAINANNIVDGTITNAKIDTVANTKLTGTITNAQLGTDAVSNTKIASGAVEQYFADTGYNAQFRNRIINGDMRIDQRNAGASVTVSTSGVYVLDRWKNRASGGGAFSVQQSTTAPTGFNNSALYTVTTVDSSIAAGDNYWIIQEIEGYNVADLDFGTANAKTITMSFWVRSSVTGTYSVFLSNGTTYNRGYVATYTINAADTWEQKSVTIAGDTTGTWGKTNGGGLSAGFNLGAGTDYQTTAGSWGSAFVQATSGTTQWISNSGATFYITGVQLEVGSVSTPFERRPYGTELALCQRYYYVHAKYDGAQVTFGRGGYYSSTQVECNVQFPTSMRTKPSLSIVSGSNYYTAYRDSGSDSVDSLIINNPSVNHTLIYNNTQASGTAGHAVNWETNNLNAFIAFVAEL
jgi:hypothetical protein